MGPKKATQQASKKQQKTQTFSNPCKKEVTAPQYTKERKKVRPRPQHFCGLGPPFCGLGGPASFQDGAAAPKGVEFQTKVRQGSQTLSHIGAEWLVGSRASEKGICSCILLGGLLEKGA